MTERDSILSQCNKTAHAQDYIMAIPIGGLNQCMWPRHFGSVLLPAGYTTFRRK